MAGLVYSLSMKAWKREEESDSDFSCVYWHRGSEEVELITSTFYGTQRLYWTKNGESHRLDGPAFALFDYESDIRSLMVLPDPRMIDRWLEENVSPHIGWYIRGVSVHVTKGKLTYPFPNITTEFIHTKIMTNPRRVRSWLKVAKALGLMDEKLRQLEKCSKLLRELF